MTETTCCLNTQLCKMARLGQENSALRAVVEDQEKELSLLREAVGHCYGIVTEPRVLSGDTKILELRVMAAYQEQP